MPILTIDITLEQAQRCAAALGHQLELKNEDGTARSATEAEVRQFVIRMLGNLVVSYEKEMARRALPAPAVFDPT